MTGVEIVLLFIGVVFMVGSFMVTEKLSTSEVNKISELSENEIDKIVDHSLQKANARIEDAIELQIEESIDKVDRALEKETNEKIMAISEYSDTVVEAMNKTHNEIMFLYSMLNDKHTELTNLSGKLQNLMGEAKKAGEELENYIVRKGYVEEKEDIFEKESEETEIVKPVLPEEFENGNHNMDILKLHKEGYSNVQIAQTLDIGIGEVKLVIGLFEGEGK
ncbi:MAG: DUF6115 domain-containing protein [Roseburia sp.]